MAGLIPNAIWDIWNSLPPLVQYLTVVTWKILFVTIGVILIVAFSTYFERKVIGSMQGRVGPNRVGPLGLGQPFADVIKLLIKEVVVPSKSNRFLFVIAPLLTLIPALATWAVIPLNDWYVIADINAGLLYVLALTSVGVYGVILAGWATNSKYAFLGAMRSAAQIVAYEIAMGFALVGILMAAGSLNLGDIWAEILKIHRMIVFAHNLSIRQVFFELSLESFGGVMAPGVIHGNNIKFPVGSC